jgi:hypothetical protein
MQRVAVIAKLKPDSVEQAKTLLEHGPPFDPEALGFERHSVYLSDGHAIFVFEGAQVSALVQTIAAAGGETHEAFAAWERLLDGLPELAQEAFSWARPAPVGSAAWGE